MQKSIKHTHFQYILYLYIIITFTKLLVFGNRVINISYFQGKFWTPMLFP